MIRPESETTPTPEPTQEVQQTETPTPEPTQEAESEGTISLEDYREVYQEMLAVAETPKRALVTVIGITSQMDYFKSEL